VLPGLLLWGVMFHAAAAAGKSAPPGTRMLMHVGLVAMHIQKDGSNGWPDRT
jgi:hypothetical protein